MLPLRNVALEIGESMTAGQVQVSDGGFLVAARGWRHPVWAVDFYPEGLPEDWRLSYYSNEFRAVVVPADYWPTVDALEVERWQEDTDEAFQFFLEVADLRTGWVDFSALVAPLAGQIGGILLRPARCDADLAQLELSLQRARQLAPVAVILPPGLVPTAAGRQRLLDHGIDPPWRVDEGMPQWTPGALALARTDSTVRTPRQWREVVENCLSFGVDSDTVLLMLEGEAPDIEALRVTMMIADMLPTAEARR